jgi:hypothetical protein
LREIALRILGTGEFVPSRHIDSEAFDEAYQKAPGWTFDQTGVRSRAHSMPTEDVIAMGAAAARQALGNAGISGTELDLIVCVGSVPAQAIPCTAALLQRELNLADSGTAAFDLNATCLGFLAALDLISHGIATGRYGTVMIVAAKRASTIGRPSSSRLSGRLRPVRSRGEARACRPRDLATPRETPAERHIPRSGRCRHESAMPGLRHSIHQMRPANMARRCPGRALLDR